MEANDFLAKIKANGNDKDLNNLAELYSEYKKIITKLPTKHRGSFSLNVLCLLCRNLDKAPSWRDSIDAKDLLTLTIDCIRETRGLSRPEQVKTLAFINYIHTYVVTKNAPLPPELILKLSFMAFEADTKNLLKEYSKTYWSIIADRLCYLEKLKGKAVHKLLPKLTEDILKTIDIYDTVPFMANAIVFLIKKLHLIFSENYSVQLNALYAEIFNKLSGKSDLSAFNSSSDKETSELYVKILDCLYVVAENSSKSCFKDSALSTSVRAGLSMLGHRSDMFHCLQTFFSNSFCDILENRTTYTDAVFKNLTVSCEITDKLGYKAVLVQTYPYLNEFLRLFIEYSINNSIKSNLTEQVQENCLNFMLKILNELKTCEQVVRCGNCRVKSGLHDALRLSVLTKELITISLQNNLDIRNLIPIYKTIIMKQYNVISDLRALGCINYEKYFRKLQTSTHNTAILLNTNQLYEFSINLFEIYIRNELIRNEIEHTNVARAFYNKSICEQNFKLHEQALCDAFLSLIFSKELSTEKYMTFVMDIKTKALKISDDDDDDKMNDELQLMSVIEACKMVMEKQMYGDLRPFFKDVKFSALLKHEFAMYVKQWPSIVPIAGVWRSLDSLLNGRREKWMTVEDPETIFWTLAEVVSLTPSAVRTIHIDYFKTIVKGLLNNIDSMAEPLSSDIRMVQTTFLFLQAEYDLAEASLRYGWKVTEPSIDPDLSQALRTLSQEYEAIQRAIKAVEIWTELAVIINTVTKKSCLLPALQLAEIFVQHFLHYSKIGYGLQLAHICCDVAKYIDEKEIFVRAASVLLHHLDTPTAVLQDVMTLASEFWPGLVNCEDSMETAIMFLCDAAIYYTKIQSVATSAKLVQLAQTRILSAFEKYPDINLELAMGRLMEAQALLCPDTGLSTLSDVNGIQRHYLSVNNTASRWVPRRRFGLRARMSRGACGSRAALVSRALRLWRRARCACAASLPAAAAARQAALYANIVNTYKMDDAQVKIDNRLKYILGLPTNSEQPAINVEPKVPMFAPKQDFETMLESQPLKSQISPTRKYVAIPGFKMPGFFMHSDCDCFACVDLFVPLFSYITSGLEASMYFRANEFEIAENYFKGVIKTFGYFDRKLEFILKSYSELDFEKYIIEYVKNFFEDQFKKIKLEILIEAAFFELTNENFEASDEHIVTVHELSREIADKDGYLNNEVMNLMIASAKLRNVVKKQEFELESEFENLKLSPKVKTEAKTPESKANVPLISARKVKEEELSKRRKVIKLNLDEHSSDEKEEKPKIKKPAQFKIPVPVTSKPVLEALTPRTTRKPNITVTDTAKTPKPEKNENFEFFTPQSTPEQFFTPLTKIKTYSRSLRKGIVKNLEEEFSTPQAGVEKENSALLGVPSTSERKVEKDRALRRATSPGKLTDSRARPRRLRQLKLNDD